MPCSGHLVTTDLDHNLAPVQERLDCLSPSQPTYRISGLDSRRCNSRVGLLRQDMRQHCRFATPACDACSLKHLQKGKSGRSPGAAEDLEGSPQPTAHNSPARTETLTGRVIDTLGCTNPWTGQQKRQHADTSAKQQADGGDADGGRRTSHGNNRAGVPRGAAEHVGVGRRARAGCFLTIYLTTCSLPRSMISTCHERCAARP